MIKLIAFNMCLDQGSQVNCVGVLYSDCLGSKLRSSFEKHQLSLLQFLGVICAYTVPPQQCLCGKAGFSAKCQDFSHSTMFMNTHIGEHR